MRLKSKFGSCGTFSENCDRRGPLRGKGAAGTCSVGKYLLVRLYSQNIDGLDNQIIIVAFHYKNNPGVGLVSSEHCNLVFDDDDVMMMVIIMTR
jgi:hypothetical protein